MLREKLIDKKVGQGKFRWRSHEVSRIEGLSDAVFGFAITLLVVSLEVPKTFTELSQMMNGFGAFAISFVLLFLVWFNQHKFFRRYGLQDAPTVWLNAALLFVVLFYVYPLKFLFTFLVNRFTGGHGEIRLPNGNIEEMIQNDGQMGTLMLIFSAGYFAVFAVFVLLHVHAYRKREMLELTTVERFDTLSSVQESALNCGIALLSICIVLIGGRTLRRFRWNDLYGYRNRYGRSRIRDGFTTPEASQTTRVGSGIRNRSWSRICQRMNQVTF